MDSFPLVLRIGHLMGQPIDVSASCLAICRWYIQTQQVSNGVKLPASLRAT